MFLFDGCLCLFRVGISFFILRRVEAYVVYVRVSNTCESRIAMLKIAFCKNITLSTSNLHWNFRKKLVKFCMWSTALCGTEFGHLGK